MSNGVAPPGLITLPRPAFTPGNWLLGSLTYAPVVAIAAFLSARPESLGRQSFRYSDCASSLSCFLLLIAFVVFP
jgi:hypothetical protein